MKKIIRKLESLVNSRPYYRERASAVLREHGFNGIFEVQWCRNNISMPWQQDIPKGIVFNDPKDQFVYELKGGDDYFMLFIDNPSARFTDSAGPL